MNMTGHEFDDHDQCTPATSRCVWKSFRRLYYIVLVSIGGPECVLLVLPLVVLLVCMLLGRMSFCASCIAVLIAAPALHRCRLDDEEIDELVAEIDRPDSRKGSP